MVELAVARREQFNTFALGGFLPDIPFLESRNLHLQLTNEDNEPLPELIIENYINDGGLVNWLTP